jgi:hypothetical protein
LCLLDFYESDSSDAPEGFYIYKVRIGEN